MSKDTHNIPKYLRKIRRLKRQNESLMEDISIYKRKLKKYACIITHLRDSLTFYKTSFRENNSYKLLSACDISTDSESTRSIDEDEIPTSPELQAQIIVPNVSPHKNPNIQPNIVINTDNYFSSTESLKKQVSWSDNYCEDNDSIKTQSSLTENDILDLNTINSLSSLFT